MANQNSEIQSENQQPPKEDATTASNSDERTISSEKDMRSFSELSSIEKIEAVLVCVNEPVTKTVALSLSEVSTEDLSDEISRKLKKLFPNDSTQVKLPENALEDIDLTSVRSQIERVLIEIWESHKGSQDT